jgi:predicted HD phosphohydrolase
MNSDLYHRHPHAHTSSNRKEDDSFRQQTGLKFKEETSKLHTWSIALYGAETFTLRKVDHKYLESFEMGCWRRIEKITWTDHVKDEVLQRVKEERNILHKIKRRKAN